MTPYTLKGWQLLLKDFKETVAFPTFRQTCALSHLMLLIILHPWSRSISLMLASVSNCPGNPGRYFTLVDSLGWGPHSFSSSLDQTQCRDLLAPKCDMGARWDPAHYVLHSAPNAESTASHSLMQMFHNKIEHQTGVLQDWITKDVPSALTCMENVDVLRFWTVHSTLI